MKYIKIYRKINGKNLSQVHSINVEYPHDKSMAAGILLREQILLQSDTTNDNLKTWLIFRETYLTKILKQKGDLICAYCGKNHLEIGGRTKKELRENNKNPNLATIDHILAKSQGGEIYNEKNLCVSCKKCNRKKGNKPVELFKEKLKEKNIDPWETLKPFKDINDIPYLPVPLRQNHINKLIKCGAIQIDKLEIGKYYKGKCRNASVAIWNGTEFIYVRNKFNCSFNEKINHFQNDNGLDLFVPLSEITPEPNQRIIPPEK